jgi:hypothetical protein
MFSKQKYKQQQFIKLMLQPFKKKKKLQLLPMLQFQIAMQRR